MAKLMLLILFCGFVFVGGMLLSIPRKFKRITAANCYNVDGTWSLRRHGKELRSLMGLGVSFALIVCVAMLPIILGLLFFNSAVMPIPMVGEILEQIDPGDAADTRSNLSRSGTDFAHRKLLKGWGFSDAGARQIQRRLFWGWPILVFVVVMSAFMLLHFVGSMYVNALKVYRRDLLHRWAQKNWGVPRLDTGFSLRVLEQIALQSSQEQRAGAGERQQALSKSGGSGGVR